jgi:hypothetical protein
MTLRRNARGRKSRYVSRFDQRELRDRYARACARVMGFYLGTRK